jgi:hypothetical protein
VDGGRALVEDAERDKSQLEQLGLVCRPLSQVSGHSIWSRSLGLVVNSSRSSPSRSRRKRLRLVSPSGGRSCPDVITSRKCCHLSREHDEDIRARNDRALSDVPGLLERLDISTSAKLWPGQVKVQR